MDKVKFALKRFGYWLAQRSMLIIALLILAVAALLLSFLLVGQFPTESSIPLAIAAVTSFFAAISAIANLLLAVGAQREREESRRPYVVTGFDGSGTGAIYLKIENMGNSPAKAIRFEFNPSPVDHANRPLDEVSLFANPISFLPPGGHLRQIVDSGHSFFDKNEPTRFEITARYTSVYGAPFEERVVHDLEYLKQATIPQKTTEEALSDISKELREIKRVAKGVTDLGSVRVESRREYLARLRRSSSTRRERSALSAFIGRLLDMFSQITRG